MVDVLFQIRWGLKTEVRARDKKKKMSNLWKPWICRILTRKYTKLRGKKTCKNRAKR